MTISLDSDKVKLFLTNKPPVNGIVMAVSGGMDSATVLALARHHSLPVLPVSFTYGSKHNKYELEAAKQLVHYYGLEHKHIILNLENIFNHVQSNLLKAGGEIPEGHYEDKSMSLTVVPGRNLIFASILSSFAQSNGYESIALGIHSGDHAIYPDCRPIFAESLSQTINYSTDNDVSHVWAPFLDLDKEGILTIGHAIGVPYRLTRTCYKDQVYSCGRCGSCRERLEAWEKIGARDPILYSDHPGVLKKMEVK